MKHSNNPLITVGIPSYNHEKYLEFCLNSIKNLNYQNIEIIFSDDCSTDNSVEFVKNFDLNNIQILTSDKNYGISINANKLIKASKGDFIAGVCSDDGFFPEKLNHQLKEFTRDPALAAVFTLPQLIDENDQHLDNKRFNIFFDKNLNNRFEFLKYFFLNCNCLLGPSLLIKRECFDDIGFYDPRLLQLQDFEFYIRLCLAGYEMKIIQEPLTYYRIRENNQNLSLKPHSTRFLFEMNLILNEHYSKINNPVLLNQIFDFIKLDHIDLMRFDFAMFSLKLPTKWHQLFGINLMYQLYENEETIRLIDKERNFSTTDFYNLTKD